MKIVLYSSAFPPSMGGFERFAETLARWLVAEGHDVVVLTATPGEDAGDGFRIVRRGSADAVARTLRWADVVHVNGLSARGIGWAVALGRRPIVTHQGYQAICPVGLAWSPVGRCTAGPRAGPCDVCPARGLRGTIDVRAHRLANARARTSVFVSRELLARVGLSGTTIYNAVLVPDRSELEFQGGSRAVVAFAGRLVQEKGLGLLLRALRSVPEAHLRVAGEGPLRRELEGLADDLGVASRTTFLGGLSAEGVAELYARSTIVCVPSVWAEPFGYAVAEAMAIGRSVVGLPTGALPELLGGGRGFLADAITSDALAKALRGALDERESRRRAAAAARAFAVRELSADVVGARYLEVYRG